MARPPTSGPPDLSLAPPAREWMDLLGSGRIDDVSRLTRAAIGLPETGPVIMGGHQPGFWHPGILAKWFAVRSMARASGGTAAWIIVDQSPGAGASLAYPATDDGGGLVRQSVDLGSAEIPPAAQPAAPLTRRDNGATPGVQAGLERAAVLLGRHASERTLASQWHRAALDGIEEMAGDAEVPVVSIFATDLHRTPAFARIVGAMREDPEGCAACYNEAARAFPEAGVRELASRDGAVELPLWERATDPSEPGPWRTVTSDSLPDLADARLALRGLPMTGLLRCWACDLFVHGTGGGGPSGYDRVTERWLGAWLSDISLAHTVVATATLRLTFPGLDIPTPEQIAAARAEAHRAEHDPSLLGDAELGRRKRELAQRIAALPRGSQEKAALFAQMQSLRGRAEQAHTPALERLRAAAESLAARADEAEIAADRTWPFVFHEPSALAALRDRIGAEFTLPSGG